MLWRHPSFASELQIFINQIQCISELAILIILFTIVTLATNSFTANQFLKAITSNNVYKFADVLSQHFILLIIKITLLFNQIMNLFRIFTFYSV